MINLRPKWLRTKLTFWYVLTLAVILLLYMCSSSLALLWQLRAQLRLQALQDLDTIEGLLFFAPDGRLQFNEGSHKQPESRRVQERLVEVVTPDGALLYRNERLGDRRLGGKPFLGEGRDGHSPRSGVLTDGTPVYLVSRLHVLQGHALIIRVAYSQEAIWETIGRTMAVQGVCLLVVLVMASLAGRHLIRRALIPLEKMADRARQISLERLHEGLQIEDGTREISNLANAFDNTLARLEQAFDQLRRFTSDASHELRTPLAAIRSVGEVGLQKSGSREEYREIIGSMLEEVNHLTRLIDSLLTLSRADAGNLQLHPSVLSVFDLVREATEMIEILAQEKAQSLRLDGDTQAMVEGDPIFLRQAFVNILDNAVKYSPAGGAISVRIHPDGTYVFVDVADNGIGIPPEHVLKIFDRFYRVDKARSREAGGTGLGLSIAKWAVQAHGGDIMTINNLDGGCTFRIQLPLYLGSDKSQRRTMTTAERTDKVLIPGTQLESDR